jgi:hypothetical protein
MMTMDRFTRGAMMVLAAALCACGSGDEDGAKAAADSTASASAPPPSATTPAPAPAPAPAGDPADPARWALRADGVGPVRVGMTVAEANDALGGGLDRTSGLEACDYVRPKAGPAGVSLMVENGRVVRVDVRDSARVSTSAGVLPGESEARVREAYPGVRVQPHKYDDRGHYMVVIPGAPADTLHRLVFETDGTKVTSMRGGLFPAVEYVEGCS